MSVTQLLTELRAQNTEVLKKQIYASIIYANAVQTSPGSANDHNNIKAYHMPIAYSVSETGRTSEDDLITMAAFSLLVCLWTRTHQNDCFLLRVIVPRHCPRFTNGMKQSKFI